MRKWLVPLYVALSWPTFLHAAVPPEAEWQARCAQRMEKAIADLQKSDPGFSASRVTAPYEVRHDNQYRDRMPGLEVRVKRPDSSDFNVPFSITVHLELTGHRDPYVSDSWTSYWGRDLNPNRRYFWAREKHELVALDEASDVSVWQYRYSRRQGHVTAFLHGDSSLERPDVLRRLVALLEPAADDCLTWGKNLSAMVSPHPIAEVPLSPQNDPPNAEPPQEPPLVLSVDRDNRTKLRIQIVRPDGKLVYRCDHSPPPLRSPLLQPGCPPPHGWFAQTDTYMNRLPRIEVTQGARKAHHAIFADGSEERILAVVNRLGFADSITVVRVLRASSDVILEAAWQPTVHGNPQYRLTNRSPRTLYGTGIYGNFFGTLERWTGSTWQEIPGSFCGTVQPGSPLRPGQSTMADLGCVIEQAAMTPGRHRFFLTYAHRGYALPVGPRSEEVFALSSEFTIPEPAASARPPSPPPLPATPAR